MTERDRIDVAVGKAATEYARAKRKLKMLGIDEETLAHIASAEVTEGEFRKALTNGEVSVNDFRRWQETVSCAG